MSDKTSSTSDNEVLIIDADNDRAQSFKQFIEFIRYSCEIVSPDQIGDMDEKEFDRYLAIFSIEDAQVSRVFLELNQKHNAQYPVVLLAEHLEKELQPALHLPYIASTTTTADYYSLSRVFDKVRNHLKRERRKMSRACQPLIGNSPMINDINNMIEQVADTMASVLILGESGTGKEVIARNIHAQSNRCDKPFVPINCGAIPADLLESELFGHEKGAFTGAISARQGRFELAEGGVIFLDEIGDMPLPMQVKLLRVLQERTYERVGSNLSINTDVRVIAATHRNLEELITEGKFREDLFYRLNVFPIEISPLRERREDIGLLSSDLIERIEKNQRGSVRLTRNASAMLSHFDWPGNVRELANLIERLAILFPYDVVDVKNLPRKYLTDEVDFTFDPVEAIESSSGGSAEDVAALRLMNGGIDMKQYITDIEISLIEQALNESNNVVARAANLLHMRRTTLVEKMRKYEIVRE